jgi:acyl CoA:acetate/3-ketoacid CoA transferase beta subunit
VTADAPYTTDEMMSVAAARALRDGTSCFVGIQLTALRGLTQTGGGGDG